MSKKYVVAIVECIDNNSVNNNQPHAICETGFIRPDDTEILSVIHKNKCVELDNKFIDGVLNHWDVLMNSPEYPLYQMIRKIKEEQDNEHNIQKQPENNEDKILEGWKKVCESFKKIELTQEEKQIVNRMLESQKKANDPEFWKNIIIGSCIDSLNKDINNKGG